jgi:two-component system, NarL family, nitrate/nitrite response regulator NarL
LETVAICDTEPIAIEGLRALIEREEGLRVITADTSFMNGMDAVREVQPSILVVDKAFGAHAIIDWLTSLRAVGPKVSVIVWSATMSQTEALRFLQAGAAGAVRKTAPLETIMKCLMTVASGGNWMEEEMLREAARPVRSGRSPLTMREAQVLELVERGLKNRDIGESLGIRTGTVKIHLKHIFEKTGIRGRYGLAISGLKQKGLLASMVPD